MTLTEAVLRVSNLLPGQSSNEAPEQPQRPTEQAWNDFHAETLAILLAGIPRTKDMKIRQDAITEIADQLTELHFRVD